MREFIDQIQKSIYGPEYYRELLGKPASFSFKYYWGYAMLLSLLLTVFTSIPIVPAANTFLREFPQKFLDYFPNDLSITIANGHASTNVPEPYYFPIPPEWKSAFDTSGGIEHLGVIDTKTPISYDAWKSEKSLFWVGSDSLVAEDQNGGIRIAPYGKLDLTVNKDTLRNMVDAVEPFFKFVPPLLVLAIFIAMLITFAVKLLYLLVAVLLIFLLGKFLKENWSYGTSYRIGLHAITLPLLLNSAVAALPIGNIILPFFPTALLLVIVYINFRPVTPAREEPASISSEPPVPDAGNTAHNEEKNEA